MDFEQSMSQHQNNPLCGFSKKRKTNENIQSLIDNNNNIIPNGNNNGSTQQQQTIRKDFLFLSGEMGLYHLDHLPDLPYSVSSKKQNSNIVYVPLKNNILINMKSYTEISFRTDQFFLGDDKGQYEKTVTATAIDFLMHCNDMKCLYVARSVVITDQTVSIIIIKNLRIVILNNVFLQKKKLVLQKCYIKICPAKIKCSTTKI